MKDLKIGETTVKLAENLDEIGIKRWTAIQQYMMVVQSNTDVAGMKDFWAKFCHEFDRQSISGMFMKAHDWLYNLSLLERGDNPDQFIFALITFEENEDGTKYNREFIQEKLERYNSAGLKQGDVKKEVENFMNGVLNS